MRVFEGDAAAASAIYGSNTSRSILGILCRGSQPPQLLTLLGLSILLSMPVAAQSYTAAIKGPQTVYAGNNLYFNVAISVPATVLYSLSSVLLSGSNVTYDVWCRTSVCGKNTLGEYKDYGGPVIL
jgi:hypothetical protein